MPYLGDVSFLHDPVNSGPYLGEQQACAAVKYRSGHMWLDRCERNATKLRDGRWPLCGVHSRVANVAVDKSASIGGPER